MISVKELSEKLEANDYDITDLSERELNLFNRLCTLRQHEGKLVRHFKNKFYLILGVVKHTETGEELVAYKAMYGNYEKYVRPIDMFLSDVDKTKYPDADQKYRMEFIDLT